MNPKLLEDVRDLLAEGPMLVSDVINSLRQSFRSCSERRPKSGRRWHIGHGFERRLTREEGFVFRMRRHGSGYAVYVGLEPFDQVWDGRYWDGQEIDKMQKRMVSVVELP